MKVYKLIVVDIGYKWVICMNDYITRPAPTHPRATIANLFIKRNFDKAKYNLYQKYVSYDKMGYRKPIFENYVEAAEIRNSTGDSKEALKLLKKGIEKYPLLRPNFSNGLSYLASDIMPLAIHLSEKSIQKGDYFGAVGLLSSALAHAPASDEPVLKEKILEYALAYAKEMTKYPESDERYSAAERMVKEALKAIPEKKVVLHGIMADAFINRLNYCLDHSPSHSYLSEGENAAANAIKYAPNRADEIHKIIAWGYESLFNFCTMSDGSEIGESEWAIKKALGHVPAGEAARLKNLLAEAYVLQAKHYASKKDYESQCLADKALKNAEQHASAYPIEVAIKEIRAKLVMPDESFKTV